MLLPGLIAVFLDVAAGSKADSVEVGQQLRVGSRTGKEFRRVRSIFYYPCGFQANRLTKRVHGPVDYRALSTAGSLAEI